jgi:uncharacterized protein YybS (DUF2232 family)
VTLKDIVGTARAALASALMFLAGTVVPIVGSVITMFAPAPLLGNAVGLQRAMIRITVVTVLGTGLVAAGAGVVGATIYLVTFGAAAIVMCHLLEHRYPFEVIVLSATAVILLASTLAALMLTGSPAALTQSLHGQLTAGITRGQSFYKALGVDAAMTQDTQTYLVDTIMRLSPALATLLGALLVLLNLAVFWRFSGREQRLGYTLFGDLGRWSSPEWLVWLLLVSGFSWFIPLPAVATIALDCFVCVAAVYFCQGLAIMSFYFKQLRMPALARALIYLVIVVQPVLTALVSAAGVFDLWVDFRRLKPPSHTAGSLGNFL